MTHQPIHVTVWDGPSDDVARVVLVHGTMSWGTECFAAQRPLTSIGRLELVDRRGFGDSPDTEQSDYDVDADDIVDILADGAHLVGHSYGGVVAMIAACRRPDAVRSLALIEPAALRAAVEHPLVAASLERVRASWFEGARVRVSPEEHLRRSTVPYGVPLPEFTPRLLRATSTAMGERPAWDAVLDLAPLAAAPWPKLIVNGTWETADPAYGDFIGKAFLASGEFIAHRIGAHWVAVDGTDHFPHRDRPEVVNVLLEELWERAG